MADNTTKGRIYTLKGAPPDPENSSQNQEKDTTPAPGQTPLEQAKNEAQGVLANKWEGFKENLGTLKDATGLGVSPEAAAAARQRMADAAKDMAKGLLTLTGPPAELVQAAYMSGNAELLSTVQNMQAQQAQAAGAIVDHVKDSVSQAYARNGVAGASAMVLTSLGVEIVGAKGAGALGKAAAKAGDIIRASKTPAEAAAALRREAELAHSAGQADEAALFNKAADERLAQARTGAESTNPKRTDGVLIEKPKGGAWDFAPNIEAWKKNGGTVTTNPDGSMKFTRKDGVSVTYDKNGYPDFSPHARESVTIDNMRGDHYHDFKSANKEINFPGSKPPEGFTWHHLQDGKTMQLVPKGIHNVADGGFPHAGGASILRSTP